MARARTRRRTTTRGRGSARRRPSRRTRSRGSLTGLAVVVAVASTLVAVDWLTSRPALLVAVVVTLAVGGLAAAGLYLAWVWSRRRRREALTRSIAAADALTGPEFEQWVATLMRRTGFTHVQVSGGAGDLGADVTAFLPDGRRLVVQCKRHRVGRSVGSPDVQKVAGTVRSVHEADVAAIVTTSGFTKPAEALAATVGIGLVGRESLARWATDDLVPVALVRGDGAGTDPVARSRTSHV